MRFSFWIRRRTIKVWNVCTKFNWSTLRCVRLFFRALVDFFYCCFWLGFIAFQLYFDEYIVWLLSAKIWTNNKTEAEECKSIHTWNSKRAVHKIPASVGCRYGENVIVVAHVGTRNTRIQCNLFDKQLHGIRLAMRSRDFRPNKFNSK